MSRIDIPTLKCDRCLVTTQDDSEMSKFRTLTGMYDKYQGAEERWDLCPTCWRDFLAFLKGQRVVERFIDPRLREAGIQHDGDPG